jgi:hypothetical protein
MATDKPRSIVTYVHRPKRPPRKKKAVTMDGPAILTKRRALPNAGKHKPEPDAPTPANDDRRPAIVTARRRPGARSSVELPDMTAEEHWRRGDAADALFRALVRQATSKR